MSFLGDVGRYHLMAVNFLIMIFGVALATLGVLTQQTYIKQAEGLSRFGEYATIIGCIVLMFGFIGCFGAFNENILLLKIYAVILIVLILCKISLAVVCFHQTREKIENKVYSQLRNWFGNYTTDYEKLKLVDLIQQKFECCGLNGKDYWQSNIPDSCCPQKIPCDIKDVFEPGCMRAVTDVISNYSKSTGGVAAAFVIIDCINVFLAYMVIKNIKEELE